MSAAGVTFVGIEMAAQVRTPNAQVPALLQCPPSTNLSTIFFVVGTLPASARALWRQTLQAQIDGSKRAVA